jgi:hypothetical protein
MKVLRNDLVIPEFEQLCDIVSQLYKELKSNNDGKVKNETFFSDYFYLHFDSKN